VRLTPTVLVVIGFSIPLLWRARRRIRPNTGQGARFERISVVIPACNEEEHLAAAISSVRAQSIPTEIVVVENGSTDATAEIAFGLADRVVRTPLPAGYSRARNLGATAARGDLLVFLDADSRMAPGALEQILAAAPRGTFGTVLGRPDPPRLRYRLFYFFKNLWHRLGLYKGVLGGLLFCDAALFRAVGGFDERMALDELHDLSLRARRAGGRYRLVPRTWASTSMRRFDVIGLWRSFRFWSCLRFRLPGSQRFRAELEAYPRFRLPAEQRDAVTVWSRDSAQERPPIRVRVEPAIEP
jgi:glycosyltransferase involved in cell wall biosynthesis